MKFWLQREMAENWKWLQEELGGRWRTARAHLGFFLPVWVWPVFFGMTQFTDQSGIQIAVGLIYPFLAMLAFVPYLLRQMRFVQCFELGVAVSLGVWFIVILIVTSIKLITGELSVADLMK